MNTLGLSSFGSLDETTDERLDIFGAILGKLADSLAKQLEDTLFACIDARLGPIWNPDEMRGRCRRVTYQFEEYEDYELDGKIMLRVWPVIVHSHNGTLSANRDIQLFD